MVKTTPPVNGYAFWECSEGESKTSEEYGAQVVRYWAQQMLTVHGRRIVLTETETQGKAKDVPSLYEWEGDECLREYIDWYMNDYDAAAKQWAWRWLVDDTFVERFVRERKGKTKNRLGYYVDARGTP